MHTSVHCGRLRTVLAIGLLLALALGARAWPASATDTTPLLTITPPNAGLTAPRVVNATGMPVNGVLRALVIDPHGDQRAFFAQTDANGASTLNLAPPDAGWMPGVYRVVLVTEAGGAVSALFAAGDGGPHLYAIPDSPSPTSALHFVGTGLAPNTAYQLSVDLTNGRGSHAVGAVTDGAGMLSVFLWPQEIPEPFFEAGLYHVSLPAAGLGADFAVREHPIGSNLSTADSAVAGQSIDVHLRDYPPDRFIWAVYAGPSGQEAGELLLGQTNSVGTLDAPEHLPANLSMGTYFLATPYDWGETSFLLQEPTPTSTDTPTTTPSPTDTPTPSPTLTPTPAPKQKLCTRRQIRRHAKNCHRPKP